MFKKVDVLIIALLFLIAIFLLLLTYTKREAVVLKVYVQNVEIIRKNISDLKDREKFEVKGVLGISVFEYVKDKGIHMISSPCPDKICIKQGFIKREGESIVCLPNKVVISLEADR